MTSSFKPWRRIYCVVEPPEKWWPSGLPRYENNPAMSFAHETSIVPASHIVHKEFDNLLRGTPLGAHHIISFPDNLDVKPFHHDYVFIRDAFVSHPNGKIVLASYKEKERRAPESSCCLKLLLSLGYDPIIPPAETCIEGGEFFVLPEHNTLLAGINRNNEDGVHFVADKLGITNVFIFESDAFHLDACLCPLINNKGEICGLLYFPEMFSAEGLQEIKSFCSHFDAEALEVHGEDSVGPMLTSGARSLGQFAINCLSQPGVLIGSSPFVTEGLHDKLKSLGIRHWISPLTQYRYSGGGVHCVINELPPFPKK
jgi:N-dimethylarginine dimethylaminohydrolase